MESDPNIEFSRIVVFDQIGVTGTNYRIEAKEDECRLLATRFQLVAIHNLSADFVLSIGEAPGWYRLEGEVSGNVIQSCVSTLKDVPAHVKAKVNILLRPSSEEEAEEEVTIDLEDEQDTEYYAEDFIDLGEIAAQYLYLNLDPFPHASDAPEFPEEPTKEVVNPFAHALKALKEK